MRDRRQERCIGFHQQPILGQLAYLKHIFVAGGEAPAFALSLRGELDFQSAEFQAAQEACGGDDGFMITTETAVSE